MKTAARIYLAALIGAGILPALPAVAQVLGDAAAGVGAMAQEQANVQAQAAGVQAQTQQQIQAQAQMQAGSAPVVTPPGTQTATTTAAALPPVATPGMGSAVTDVSSNPPSLNEDEDDSQPGTIKVPKSVKGAIKKLDNATDKVTLDDLNSAREAVAKLDALLDIEKRLSDLATIRREREEKSMASAIPASAFGMPPMMAGRGGPPPSAYPPPGMDTGMAPSAPPMMMPSNDPEVNRIMGANGHYVALIKGMDGKNQRIHEGDKLPDGSLVETISSQGLTVVQGKTKHTIRVKDSGTVFGGR